MVPHFDFSNMVALNSANSHVYDVASTDHTKYNGFVLTVTDTVTLGVGDNIEDYATTGLTQVIDIVVDDIVYFEVASGTTGTGVLKHYYKSKAIQSALDLDLETFDTDTANWEDLGFSTGNEIAVSVSANEVVALNGNISKIVGTIDSTILFTY